MSSLGRDVSSVQSSKASWLLAFFAAVACGDEATIITRAPDADNPVVAEPESPDGEQAPPAAPPAAGPVYAFQSVVFNPDDSTTTYIALTDSLDFSRLTLDNSREFASYAFMAVLDGKLMISDGEAPVVTRYDITPELGWNELDRVSFANQGVTGGAAGFERHWFVNENTAYVTLDVTQRVIWNPSSMLIEGVAEDSALELTRDGLVLDASFNRQPRMLGGPILKPFYYRDEEWYRFGPSSTVAMYDPVTHREQSVVDVPCPALELPSRDEQGNTYYSSWTYGPEASLFGEGPAPCVRRITPQGTLDEGWAPDLDAWTGGRPVMVFRYMRDGKAIGTVLHSDEAEIDYSAGYTDEAATELYGHYKLWMFDLQNETAQPIEDISGVGSNFYWANVDGRTFIFMPNEEWSRSTIYELSTDGSATEVFQTTGWAYDMMRVR